MKRILILAAAVLAVVPADAGAQERAKRPPASGMVMEAGEWRAPTPATALRSLLRDDSRAAAVAVLRQRLGPFSAAELDAFAADLADVIRNGTKPQATEARMALISSAATYDDHDVPYAGATRAFVRLYESYEDSLGHEADMALFGVMQTGGVEYVRRLFEASEQPPPCQDRTFRVEVPENPCPNVCTWCQAGFELLQNGVDGAPDEDLWKALCERRRI